MTDTLEKLNKRMDLLNNMTKVAQGDLSWAVKEWNKLDEAKRAVVAAEAQAKKALEGEK